MKNIRKYTQFAISAIIATLFITSCEDPVDIDYIDYEPLVVVNSINEVDSTLKMRLTYSRWFLDNQSFKEVDNANITLKVNGNTIGNATSTLINDKKYYNHSGFPGGLRERTAKVMINEYPEEMLERAVKGMLPHNRLGRKMGKKLFVYRGSEHKQMAQQPKEMKVD